MGSWPESLRLGRREVWRQQIIIREANCAAATLPPSFQWPILGTVGCLELLPLFKLFFGLRWVFAFSSCEQGLKGTQAQWLWPEGYVALQHVGLRSLTRDWTCIPCIGRQVLNHWTTREVPLEFLRDRETDSWWQLTSVVNLLCIVYSLFNPEEICK